MLKVTCKYTIIIKGLVKGKKRHRSTKKGRIYNPKENIVAESWIRLSALEQVKLDKLLHGPVRTELFIDVAISDSWSNKKKAAALLGEIRPTKKPDLDNSLKMIYDALNGVIWVDDCQVVEEETKKFYGMEHRAILHIYALENFEA